jgi:hypothetical protein
MNQFDTVENIVDYYESIQDTKFDTILPLSELRAVPLDNTIGLSIAKQVTPLERMWGVEQQTTDLPAKRAAWRNLFYRLGLGKGWQFMRDSVSPVAPKEGAELLNALIQHEAYNSGKRGPKNIMVRSRGEINGIYGTEEAVHRALFSDKYVPLDNLRTAKIVQDYMNQFANIRGTDTLITEMRKQHGIDVSIVNDDGSSGISHKIVRPNINIDNMSFRTMLNMKFHSPEIGNFFIGAYIKSSEDGSGSHHVLGYINRLICDNGMMASFDRSEITAMRQAGGWAPIIYHRWDDEEGLALQMHKAMSYALAAGTELIQKAQEAQRRNLPGAQDIMSQMLTNLIPKDNLHTALLDAGTGTEGDTSIMGLVNGLTYAAHNKELGSDVVDELEAVAGTMLRKYDAEMEDRELRALFLGLAKVELLHGEDGV